MSETNTLPSIQKVQEEAHKIIVGQEDLIEKIIIALICKGHILIEGIPGLAKSLTIDTLAQCLSVSSKRIQFTPDLLPGDITGTEIFNQQTNNFQIHKGPIFSHFVLADEINRSPAKVQSALLEAMQEKQVSIGNETYPLPQPFMVLATQNPIEQEGTYPLPEAQMDRFLFKIILKYPSQEDEHKILKRMASTNPLEKLNPILDADEIQKLQQSINNIHLEESLEKYILNIVDATRFPEKYNLDIDEFIRLGASPRATINLALSSKALAMVRGRDYVTPDDIQFLAKDILRHRILLNYKAALQNIAIDDILDKILGSIIPEK